MIDLIPFLGGIIAGLLYLLAFVVELIGLLQLKNARTLGAVGKNGITQLLVANGLSILAALFGILPFIGSFFAAFLYLIALALAISGWLKVQQDLTLQELAKQP